jgi:hypothetical protein
MRQVKPVPHPSLQLDEHLRFQQVLFTVRFVGMLLLVAGVLAALAGLFGASGPLARGQERAGAAMAERPRFARYHAPTRFEFELASTAVDGDSFELVLEGEHVRQFRIEQVTPQPQEVVASGDRIHFTFAAAPGERQYVIVAGQPETIGMLAGTATLAGEPPLPIDSFVYP